MSQQDHWKWIKGEVDRQRREDELFNRFLSNTEIQERLRQQSEDRINELLRERQIEQTIETKFANVRDRRTGYVSDTSSEDDSSSSEEESSSEDSSSSEEESD